MTGRREFQPRIRRRTDPTDVYRIVDIRVSYGGPRDRPNPYMQYTLVPLNEKGTIANTVYPYDTVGMWERWELLPPSFESFHSYKGTEFE